MANCHAFTIKGQAERVNVQFFVASTDAPFAGTMTGLTATLVLDHAAPVASTNALTQVGTSSWAYLDLTADEMNHGSVLVTATCTNNPGVVAAGLDIPPLDLSPQTSPYGLLADVRLERLFVDLHDYLWGRNEDSGATQTVYNSANVAKGSGTIVEGDVVASRSKIQ